MARFLSPLSEGCTLQVRDATEADLPAILAITNEVIRTTTAIYSHIPATLEDRQAWFAQRIGQSYPVLVAEAGGAILGFTSFGDFRSWPGYRHTVEHSVHVDAPARGQGVGRALLTALLPRAEAMGKHAIVGAIDADNAASLRLHERLGFAQVGLLPQVGRKFDRWLDLVFMHRVLGDGAP